MCWGNNDNGRLGDGTTTDSTTPVAVSLPAGSTATALALGSAHSCAILDDGSVHCSGNNYYGQLGDGTTTNSNTPVIATEMDTSLEITNSVDTVYSTPMSEFVASYDNVFATRSVDNYLYRLDPNFSKHMSMKMLLLLNLIVADNNDIHLIAESEQYGKEIYECSHASSTCSIVYDTNTEIEKYGEPTPGDIGSTAHQT